MSKVAFLTPEFILLKMEHNTEKTEEVHCLLCVYKNVQKIILPKVMILKTLYNILLPLFKKKKNLFLDFNISLHKENKVSSAMVTIWGIFWHFLKKTPYF